MSQEVALWAGGVTLLPAIGWAIAVLWILRDIKRGTDRLLEIHSRENADAAGFGTVKLQTTMNNVLRCLQELVHYTKWEAQQRTGRTPPPYMKSPEDSDP